MKLVMNIMSKQARPNVLSIAGFDPSAGAGILADIKTFEYCDTYGMGVVSALTYQNDISFEKAEWLGLSQMIAQIEILQKRFQFEYIKIGLIENLEVLLELITYLKTIHNFQLITPKIIWDPILKASAGFEFHNNVNQKLLETVCSELFLITPNIPESLQLGTYNDAQKNAKQLSRFCNVYLKGGHSEEKKGTDFLFTMDGREFLFPSEISTVFPKHGSGCVLSAAITANLSKGMSLETACSKAKKYAADFLLSNDSLLGFHSNNTFLKHE